MDVIHCQRCGAATEPRVVEGRERPVCPACGAVSYLDPKLAVAVLMARDGRILLGRRGPDVRAAGRWSFPAGFVERGETVEAAAVREVREEVGVAVDLGPLLALLSAPGDPVVLAVYAALGFAGEPAAADDLVELAWFAPNELPDLAFPRDAQIIAAWLSRPGPLE